MTDSVGKSNVHIKKGRIFIYRVYDVGDEINLEMASKILELSSSPQRFKLRRETRAVVMSQAPLQISLGTWAQNIRGKFVNVEAVGKLWHFGAISVNLQLQIPENCPWEELIDFARPLENDPTLDELALQKINDIAKQISSCIQNRAIWGTYEDYIIYFIESLTGPEANASEIFAKADVPSLILGEKENLSQQMKSSINENYFQYSVSDLAVIDWNSALLIEPSGSMDVADIIEFSLCQLLELRYYDDLLDMKLNALYSAIERRRYNALSNTYAKLSEEACQKYLEISEIVENVENSLKVVGDFYLANIFRAAARRFKFGDWQGSVDNKLNNLAEVSKILDSKVNERRGHLLEIIIILLIALEFIPLLTSLLKNS